MGFTMEDKCFTEWLWVSEKCEAKCFSQMFIDRGLNFGRQKHCFFKIQFWYLRCCGCPWNRGRQHLATPLKTCHNAEAVFLQGGCSAYPPTQRWRHLRLRRSRTWAVCLPLSPQKGDHLPSHDDNFARTSVCRWLPQKPTDSQVEAARNPEKGGLYSDLPTPRWTCLKTLSGLHLPSFEIRVFLLLDGFTWKG